MPLLDWGAKDTWQFVGKRTKTKTFKYSLLLEFGGFIVIIAVTIVISFAICISSSPVYVIKDFKFSSIFNFSVKYFLWTSPLLFLQILLNRREVTFCKSCFSLRCFVSDCIIKPMALKLSPVIFRFLFSFCFRNLCYIIVDFLQEIKKKVNVGDSGLY